jgi:hypothetical protein
METNWHGAVLRVLALLNYSFAFMVSIEITVNDLLPKKRKLAWHTLTWLLPLLGPFLTHRMLQIGWAKGSGSGGDSIVPPE